MNERFDNKASMPISHSGPKVLGIMSGKGGVGKSIVTFNLARALSEYGRVIMIDGDFQSGNLHLLGNATPNCYWQDVCLGRASLKDAVISIDTNLDLLATAGGRIERAYPDIRSLAGFVNTLTERLKTYDYIVFDSASGLLPHTAVMLQPVDEAILVTTPELTSLTNCYALYKILATEYPRLSVSLLVNRENGEEEIAYIRERFTDMTGRFLGRTPGFCGGLNDDPVVVESVACQKALAVYAPESVIRRQFHNLARRIASGRTEPTPVGDGIRANINAVTADIKE